MNDIRNRPAGFTLIELLAVLGIIALIAAISVPVITGFLGTSREAATATTLLKIDGWLTERREALDKALNQQDRTQTGRRDPDAQAKAYLERLANQNIYGIRLRAAQILMKKDIKV